MSKNKKILVGILTFSPIIGMIFYFICFISMFLTIEGIVSNGTGADQDLHPEKIGTFIGLMGTAMIVLLLTMLISVGMMIYYIIHVLNNKQLSPEKKRTHHLGITRIDRRIYWPVRLLVYENMEGNAQ